MDRRGERDLDGGCDRSAGDRVRVRPREGVGDGIGGGDGDAGRVARG